MTFIKNIILTIVIWIPILSCDSRPPSAPPLSLTASQEKKVTSISPIWADEFNTSGAPDSSKWGYDLGDGCPDVCGWGNNELQFYTSRSKNVRVENGQLIIEAHKESYGNKEFTSARLVSRQKGDWQYGRIEVRAKLPRGTGTWPAIWMLPTEWAYGGWPSSGEIDIMEHVGYNQGMIYGTVHTKAFNHGIGTQQGDSLMVGAVENNFHIYSIDWSAKKIDFKIDGKTFNTFRNNGEGYESWPFDKPFHLLLNLAVGGNWGGAKGVDTTIWPQKLIVDYVRIYKAEENL